MSRRIASSAGCSRKRGAHDLPSPIDDVHGEGVELAADWDHLASPETYLGFARGKRFASERDDQAGSYVVPRALRLNQWGLAGAWAIRQDGAHLGDGTGAIAYRFRARDVNLVLGSTRGETPFRVSIDGAEPAFGPVSIATPAGRASSTSRGYTN